MRYQALPSVSRYEALASALPSVTMRYLAFVSVSMRYHALPSVETQKEKGKPPLFILQQLMCNASDIAKSWRCGT